MKQVFSLIILSIFFGANAQEFRKYLPFEHKNRWGIIDSSNVEILKPQYKDVQIFDNFTNIEMESKMFYNLKTGESFPAFGEYRSTIEIQDNKYYLFTNEEQSILINIENKDTIKLNNKYRRMTGNEFYDENSKKYNSLIFGYITNDTFIILKNEKDLPMFISGKYKRDEIETIKNSKNIEIGFALKVGQNIQFYDSKFRLLRKLKNTIDHYTIITKEIGEQLPQIYNDKGARAGCFNCAEVWNSNWSMEKALTNNISSNPRNNSFFLTLEKRNYYLNSRDNVDFKKKISLNKYSFSQDIRIIRIKESNSTFFYDHRYMNTDNIHFPEQYFLELK